MALIIYDGTNPTTAEALASVTDCSTFAAAYYGHSLSGSDADKEAAIRRANAYMMSLPWVDSPTYGLEQTVPFPRGGSDKIPWQVVSAQHKFARAEFIKLNALSPNVSASEQVTREKVGPLEVEYAEPKSADAAQVLVTDALRDLKPFLKPTALAQMGLTDPSAPTFTTVTV